MIDAIGGPAAFFVLGLLLPVLSVAVTIAWLIRRGLLHLKWWPLFSAKAPTASVDALDLSTMAMPTLTATDVLHRSEMSRGSSDG
jgi:hypothetical protein